MGSQQRAAAHTGAKAPQSSARVPLPRAPTNVEIELTLAEIFRKNGVKTPLQMLLKHIIWPEHGPQLNEAWRSAVLYDICRDRRIAHLFAPDIAKGDPQINP